MSKYIDRSKVNDEIVRVLEHTDCKGEYIDRVLRAIESLPTIDIVHCKDCRRKDKCEKIVVYEHFCGDIYDAEKIHFCEHGERIEE